MEFAERNNFNLEDRWQIGLKALQWAKVVNDNSSLLKAQLTLASLYDEKSQVIQAEAKQYLIQFLENAKSAPLEELRQALRELNINIWPSRYRSVDFNLSGIERAVIEAKCEPLFHGVLVKIIPINYVSKVLALCDAQTIKS